MSVREFDDGADDWMDHGACRASDVNPDWFFSQSQPTIDRAKQVCAGCDHVAACLAYAVEHGEVGVWGGTDDVDRRRDRRLSKPMPTRCRNGHLLTADNVHVHPDGRRRCKTCSREYQQEYQRNRRTELTVVRGGQT